MKKLTLCFAVVFSIASVFQTQSQNNNEIVESYLNDNYKKLGYELQDIQNYDITNDYVTKKSGVNHIIIQQTIANIPVFNAYGNFAVRDNKVLYFGNSLLSNIHEKVNTTSPTLNAIGAIESALGQLEISDSGSFEILEQEGHSYVITNGGVSQENIPAKLTFQRTEEGTLRLAWDISILTNDSKFWWSVRVDAVTGDIISKDNWMLSCNFGESAKAHENHVNKIPSHNNFGVAEASMLNDGSLYNVYPIPVESPIHGARQLVSEPANLNASPFGWHDTNGAAGPEFTNTRGNNVTALEDAAGDNGTNGFGPDGGATLNFDFPLDFNQNPDGYQSAAITNLFFWNNLMHDVWYEYGFDEASGNFQQNNYNNGGIQFDAVVADAQDGSGTNNANFGTPPDGGAPRMQMFLWSPSGPPGTPLTITSPNDLAGDIEGLEAGFGGSLSDTPIAADLALMVDTNSNPDPNDACETLTGASISSLNGNIAVARRGDCNFTVKVSQAQQAGAIAAIVVNNIADPIFSMGGTDASITIPSIMISQADGEALIAALQNGETISAELVATGPYSLDGDLDNGIIAHEYGHGISTRLTGGANTSSCLNNAEQMGEGWSDYFGLMLTIEPGDLGTDIRGIGNYVIGAGVNGGGIRPAPYSTDFAINAATYNDTNNAAQISEPHGIGFVWSTILWEMTWDLIDEYGFDADFYNGTGGNNLAMQLVIDGLKLQPCNPGFVDGRDAILAADMINNNGANQCLIYDAFARRGLGFSASQGSSFSRTDQVEAFDMPPVSELDCTNLSVAENDINLFKVFPNPTSGKLNIVLNNIIDTSVSVKLYDIQGRNVLTNTVNDLKNSITIDVSNIETGVYLLQLDVNGKSYSEKVVID